MTKTMLTCKTLERFEAENLVYDYTDRELKLIEDAAYIANTNNLSVPGWDDTDIYADFLRILSIYDITVTARGEV